ncbi:hypothetical protein A3Q56_03542 [Intoshia linei]|uniref:URB1 N-terminal domain-containing protein n=1 Tax=Intoshia linei TaxID=1819745 RepID=A0A177B4Z3_9BILA|nr:hypothetical protein A3Q56_03542 [Intoshia linei]
MKRKHLDTITRIDSNSTYKSTVQKKMKCMSQDKYPIPTIVHVFRNCITGKNYKAASEYILKNPTLDIFKKLLKDESTHEEVILMIFKTFVFMRNFKNIAESDSQVCEKNLKIIVSSLKILEGYLMNDYKPMEKCLNSKKIIWRCSCIYQTMSIVLETCTKVPFVILTNVTNMIGAISVVFKRQKNSKNVSNMQSHSIIFLTRVFEKVPGKYLKQLISLKANVLTSTFFVFKNLNLKVVYQYLKSIYDHIILNTLIPKSTKLFLFNSNSMSIMASNYFWKNPSLESTENEEIVWDQVDAILQTTCCDTRVGIVFDAENETLKNFILNLNGILTSRYKRRLVINIITNSPRLFSVFVEKSKIFNCFDLEKFFEPNFLEAAIKSLNFLLDVYDKMPLSETDITLPSSVLLFINNVFSNHEKYFSFISEPLKLYLVCSRLCTSNLKKIQNYFKMKHTLINMDKFRHLPSLLNLYDIFSKLDPSCSLHADFVLEDYHLFYQYLTFHINLAHENFPYTMDLNTLFHKTITRCIKIKNGDGVFNEKCTENIVDWISNNSLNLYKIDVQFMVNYLVISKINVLFSMKLLNKFLIENSADKENVLPKLVVILNFFKGNDLYNICNLFVMDVLNKKFQINAFMKKCVFGTFKCDLSEKCDFDNIYIFILTCYKDIFQNTFTSCLFKNVKKIVTFLKEFFGLNSENLNFALLYSVIDVVVMVSTSNNEYTKENVKKPMIPYPVMAIYQSLMGLTKIDFIEKVENRKFLKRIYKFVNLPCMFHISVNVNSIDSSVHNFPIISQTNAVCSMLGATLLQLRGANFDAFLNIVKDQHFKDYCINNIQNFNKMHIYNSKSKYSFFSFVNGVCELDKFDVELCELICRACHLFQCIIINLKQGINDAYLHAFLNKMKGKRFILYILPLLPKYSTFWFSTLPVGISFIYGLLEMDKCHVKYLQIFLINCSLTSCQENTNLGNDLELDWLKCILNCGWINVHLCMKVMDYKHFAVPNSWNSIINFIELINVIYTFSDNVSNSFIKQTEKLLLNGSVVQYVLKYKKMLLVDSITSLHDHILDKFQPFIQVHLGFLDVFYNDDVKVDVDVLCDLTDYLLHLSQKFDIQKIILPILRKIFTLLPKINDAKMTYAYDSFFKLIQSVDDEFEINNVTILHYIPWGITSNQFLSYIYRYVNHFDEKLVSVLLKSEKFYEMLTNDATVLLNFLTKLFTHQPHLLNIKIITVLLCTFTAKDTKNDNNIYAVLKLFRNIYPEKDAKIKPYIWSTDAINFYSIKKQVSIPIFKKATFSEILQIIDRDTLYRTCVFTYLPLCLQTGKFNSIYISEFLLNLIHHLVVICNEVFIYRNFFLNHCFTFCISQLTVSNHKVRKEAYDVLNNYSKKIKDETFHEKYLITSIYNCIFYYYNDDSSWVSDNRLSCPIILEPLIAQFFIQLIHTNIHSFGVFKNAPKSITSTVFKQSLDAFKDKQNKHTFSSILLTKVNIKIELMLQLDGTTDYRIMAVKMLQNSITNNGKINKSKIFEKSQLFCNLLHMFSNNFVNKKLRIQICTFFKKCILLNKTIFLNLLNNHSFLNWIIQFLEYKENSELRVSILQLIIYSGYSIHKFNLENYKIMYRQLLFIVPPKYFHQNGIESMYENNLITFIDYYLHNDTFDEAIQYYQIYVNYFKETLCTNNDNIENVLIRLYRVATKYAKYRQFTPLNIYLVNHALKFIDNNQSTLIKLSPLKFTEIKKNCTQFIEDGYSFSSIFGVSILSFFLYSVKSVAFIISMSSSLSISSSLS